jgi:hypothetical protein
LVGLCQSTVLIAASKKQFNLRQVFLMRGDWFADSTRPHTRTMEQDIMMINPMSPQRAAILAVLQQTGRPMRLFEIANATGMKPTNVANLLYRMREDGQADYTGPRAVRRWTATTADMAHHGALANLGL